MPGNLPVPPASVTSHWPAPNYIDPIRRTWMPAYAITIHLVGTALVCIRFGLRARKQGGALGLDDALLLPSWVLSTVLTALAIWSSKYGLIDRHIWDVPHYKISNEALNAWIASFVFLLGSCFFKVSVLLFYRRIQSGTYNPRWMIAIYSAIGFTITYTTALLLALVFNCMPLDAYWKAYDPAWKEDYHCVNTIAVSVLAGVLSVIGDAYSVILPCVMLQGLKITRSQKIGLNFVFAFGSVVVIAGIVRTYEFHRLTREWDTTWVGFDVYVWSILEYELGIMCACAPTLRMFMKTYVLPPMRKCWQRSHWRNLSPHTRKPGKDVPDSTWDAPVFDGTGISGGTMVMENSYGASPRIRHEEEGSEKRGYGRVDRPDTSFKIPPGVWASPSMRDTDSVDEFEAVRGPPSGREKMSVAEFFVAERKQGW